VRNCLPRNSKGVVSAIGSRAFSVSGPQTWKQLPEEITSAAEVILQHLYLSSNVISRHSYLGNHFRTLLLIDTVVDLVVT